MRVVDHQARTPSLATWADAVRAILWRLRDRHDRRASLGLFLTICLVSGTLAVIPRLVNQTINTGVVAAVNDATRTEPGISLNLNASLPVTTSDPLATVAGDGQQFQAGMAPPIQSAVTGFSYLVESQRFSLINPAGPVKNSRYFQTFLTLRYQSGLDRPGLVTLDSGQLPKAIPPVSPSIFKTAASDLGDQPLPAFQIALDQVTAQALQVKLGDWVILQPDASDSKTTGIPSAYLNYTLAGQVSGIFAAAQANDHYWQEDDRLLQPSVQTDGTTTHVYGFGLIAPAAYPALLAQTSPVNWTYTWRYELDPNRVNAGNEQTLERSIRSLLLTHGAATTLTSDPSAVSLNSPLVTALDQFHSQRTFFVAIATMATLGVLAVAFLLLILVSLLLIERSSSGIVLLRVRGATGRQLLWAQAVQATLIAIPAVAIGYLAARIVIPVQSPGLDIVLSLGTGLVAIGLATVAAQSDARMPLGRLLNRQRDQGQGAGGTARRQEIRITLEMLVVLLAAVGIYLVRRRGVIASGSGGVDPYLALVPFLAGMSAGILVLRLYPIPVWIVTRIARRRRGIVVWVSLRRVLHQSLSAQLPMLALLVAVGVAVFSLVVDHSLAVAQSTAVWQTVGADARIDAPTGDSLPGNLNIQALAGVQAVVPADYQPSVSINDGGNSGNGALLAIDPGAYQRLTQGTPAAVQFPAALSQPPTSDDIGSQANPLPAIVSPDWPGGVKIGQSLQVTLESVTYWIRVSGIVTSFPSIPVDVPFVITSRAGLQAANPDVGLTLPITRFYVRGSGRNLTSPLQQAIRDQAPEAILTTRSGALADTSRQLLAGRVTTVFRYSVVLVTLYAAAAGSIGLMLASVARQRDLSYLRTLGLSTRQALGITVVEQLPPVFSAVVVGAGLGVAIARLISPALNLSAFAGRAGVSAGVVIGWWQIAALAGGISLVVLMAIVSFGLLTRHLDLATTLRLGGR